jgi:hypothetical protein
MPKMCSRRGLEKSLSAFYKQAGDAEGRRGMCKGVFPRREAGILGVEIRGFRSAGARSLSGGGMKR